jgi:quercetin dioxygenase-like cupin family protein
MEIYRIEEFFRGWFIGNFKPAVYETDQFEIGLLSHKKDEVWPTHFHKIATEYNLLISGSMTLNGTQINVGDLFIIKPGEIADPKFLEDCKILVVKTPSIPGDKYEVKK